MRPNLNPNPSRGEFPQGGGGRAARVGRRYQVRSRGGDRGALLDHVDECGRARRRVAVGLQRGACQTAHERARLRVQRHPNLRDRRGRVPLPRPRRRAAPRALARRAECPEPLAAREEAVALQRGPEVREGYRAERRAPGGLGHGVRRRDGGALEDFEQLGV